MHIALMASGTRGDVQPMIALAKGLQQVGHRVRLLAGENFAPWVRAHGLEIYPTADVEALMRSDLGVRWTEGANQLAQLRAMKALNLQMLERTVHDTIEGTRDADLLIGGFLAESLLQAVGERRAIPHVSVALQPYRATRVGPASLVAPRPRARSMLNLWMGRMADRLLWWAGHRVTNRLRERLGLRPHTAGSYRRTARVIPALYAMSRHVVPPLDDANVHTTGFLFLDEHETPSEDLLRFLDVGEPPVYIGFGSMPGSDPQRTVALVARALAEVGQRGVLARGWSSTMTSPDPDRLLILDRVDHGWLFPRVSVVVHHGGAGTTAAGLRAGRPTLIVPHLADQPFWGRRVHELGVGAPPIPRQRLTERTLARSLDLLVPSPGFAANAAVLGAAIRDEQGVSNAVTWIESHAGRLGQHRE
jgi:sterol 3beta-glucosyltransferase